MSGTTGEKRKGKNFVGDRKKQRYVETIVSHIMKEIDDNLETKKKGFTIRKCVANYKIGLDGDGEPSFFGPLDWLTEAQIYGLRKRAKKRKQDKDQKERRPPFSIKCPTTGRELFPGRSFDTDSGDEEELRTNFVTPTKTPIAIGGRKNGSPQKMNGKYEEEEKIRRLANDIAREWAKREVSDTDERSLSEIIGEKRAEHNLPHVCIPHSTLFGYIERYCYKRWI